MYRLKSQIGLLKYPHGSLYVKDSPIHEPAECVILTMP